MKCTSRMLAGVALIGSTFGSTIATAAVIYSENFQDPTYQGASLGLGGSLLQSERYPLTEYFRINNANGWTFNTASTFLAVGSGGDAGVLLNETNGSAEIDIPGLSIGSLYLLTFNHSGDNIPGSQYQITLNIDGNPVSLTSPRSWSATGAGIDEAVFFTATSSNVKLTFGETSTTPASPIIDNIVIQRVPEPTSLALVGLGLLGLGYNSRKKARFRRSM